MRWIQTLAIAGLLAAIAGCASGPTVRSDVDPGSDLGRYRTFAFFEPLATDRDGYGTILSSRLKAATRRELEERGYRYSESSPDLRVNFYTNVKERQEIRSTPEIGFTGFYHYRRGFYNPWVGYPYDVRTINYTEGTLSIDLVDASRKQLVWQGLAKGTVTKKVRDNPGPAIDAAVARIFEKFPARASQ